MTKLVLGWLTILAGATNAQPPQFVQLSDYELPSSGDWRHAIAVGDLDGDGADDVVAGTVHLFGTFALPGQNRVYLNDGHGRLRDVTGTHFPAVKDLTVSIALGDVDGDRDLDLFVGNRQIAPGTGRNRLYLNDGTGKFTEVTATHLPPQSEEVTIAVAFLDIDGDRDPDLYVGQQATQDHLYRNDGRGRFTDVSSQLPSEPFAIPETGDVDGDGDVDIVLFKRFPILLLNDGKGRYSIAKEPFPPRVEILEGALRDFDRDGDLDIVGKTSQEQHYWLNTGAGKFKVAPPGSLPRLSTRPNDLVAADFDLDGACDLLFGGGGSGWAFLSNDGKGRFVDQSKTRLLPNLPSTITYAPGDFDRDGDVDIAIVPDGGPKPGELFLNLHRHTFSLAAPVVGQPWGLYLVAQPGYGNGQVVVPYLAPGLLQRAFPLPPFGHFGLDPAAMLALPPAALTVPGGLREIRLPIPNDAMLRGRPLHAQSLVLHGGEAATWRLTNVFTATIR